MSARKAARTRRRVPHSVLSPRLAASSPRPIAIANHHPRLRLDRRAISRAIHLLDAKFPKANVPAGELSLVFLTDAALARLHADFLADPSLTDVITFEGNAALGTAGEICVSADAASRQIAEFVVPVSAERNSRPPKGAATNAIAFRLRTPTSRLRTFSAELTLYLVHGWLHLAGFDDLEPKKKRLMRRAEARALRLLTRADAVPAFTLRGSPQL